MELLNAVIRMLRWNPRFRRPEAATSAIEQLIYKRFFTCQVDEAKVSVNIVEWLESNHDLINC